LERNTTKNKESKILSSDDLLQSLARERKAGKKIVFTNGCFDILHVGHIRYLYQAKAMGDILVVGLNSDSSVKEYKGQDRPIVPEDERAEVLAALEMVDYIVIFSERTPEEIILKIRPDIQVKGGDYTIDQIPEAGAVESCGGKVVIVPEVKGKATTNIIEKIKKSTL
jgi:D-glycero-beta-D-manno-heptose 1-phosphate adenylyltransferase